MGNLDPLLAGIKRLAVNGVLLSLRLPPSIVLNVVTAAGLNVAYNVVTGQYDLTGNGAGGGLFLTQQVVTNGQTVAVGSMAWIDTTAGSVTFNAPTFAAAVLFGACDAKKGGSWSVANSAQLANPNANIEDPGHPGVYTSNPILLQAGDDCVAWQVDPTNSFAKVVLH